MAGCDVAVIGAGPGGYTAAIRCAQLGARVVLIERDEPGGTCLNRGCIPTKALLSTAALIRAIREAGRHGLRDVRYEVEFGDVMKRKERVVDQLRGGLLTIFKSYGIEMLRGEAAFVNEREIEVAGKDGKTGVAFGKAIIATGSVPSRIPGLEMDGKRVVTSDHLLAADRVPESLLIAGGGVVGVEFAIIFSQLGSRVTIVEMMPQILPGEDPEVAGALAKMLSLDGIEIRTGEGVRSVPDGRGKVLVATGRKPYFEGLGLDRAGVRVENGRIAVSPAMETGVSGIYAVGDATGGILLAHKAAEEGLVAAENAVAGAGTEVNYDVVPNCIFTIPQVATVGLTEARAKERGIGVKVGRFPFAASGRAVAGGDTRGFVKMVVDAGSGGILGVQIIGPEATELIAQASLLIGLEATTESLKRIAYPHPTLSEALHCAAAAVEGKAIDLPKSRR